MILSGQVPLVDKALSQGVLDIEAGCAGLDGLGLSVSSGHQNLNLHQNLH